MKDGVNSIENLETDVAMLRERVKELQASQEETTTHRIYIEARRRLLAFVSVGTIVVTAFGLISVSKLIESIEKQVQERGVESIIGEIKSDFAEEHTGRIIEIIRVESSERMSQEIYAQVRDGFSRVEKAAKDVGENKFASKIKSSYESDRYFVIAGSSVKRLDLVRELERVKQDFGQAFEREFPQADIYPPKPGKKHYALVVSHGLEQFDAQKVLEHAIAAGFRSDSYIGVEAKTGVDLSE